MYRKGNYALQHIANQNPDNWFNKNFDCWTTDPNCGLDLAPKRPELDLKDPGILHKHDRDVLVNPRIAKSGHHGY